MDPAGRAAPPSLNALRAFEAAARHGGYVAAAQELHVTPAAIGAQVKGLEAWLGRPLFPRRPNGLCLTVEGRAVLPSLTTAFDALNHAVRAMRAVGRPRSLTLAALPCIAQLWLAPRLPALQATFDLDVAILTRDDPPDYARELVDLGLYFGEAAPAGCSSVVLARDDLFPVCGPALAAGLRHPRDLSGATLLHDSVWREDWPRWLGRHGAGALRPAREAAFSLYGIALDAALAGHGVLIGHSALVGEALAAGRLVAPFGDRVVAGAPLRLIVPEGGEGTRLAGVIRWLSGDETEAGRPDRGERQ
ncbi:LysR substrate-binding domain-containing protein [Methylobacterium frigidaeris]|uniref:Glycine cleavage system transcriptional activator n=1 Tax=Methylobacterium frigidaeris TaxID=2038277 RepID=A0AA37HDB6_9HYPH|nr:LysR substrate-binding domain-containing protein [Methylobacterium frigidaeris]PIK69397.1 LysR family transcriptional regulator [Methylobacterium frigidaeris]GJD63692.1 Glycine cleavage system transcriptional activator [Methylobacterium frigidaeris]